MGFEPKKQTAYERFHNSGWDANIGIVR